MIHITLGAMRYVNPKEDQLGRDHVGWDPNMDDEALFRANRGCWVLGERADREQYALLSSQGIARQAIEGRFLEAGHPVHDAYVGKPQPVEPTRNPVTYFESAHAVRECGCGCGAPVTLGWFLTGHDQKALHDRVARIGTVREFIDWFDRIHTEGARTMSSRIVSIAPHANDKNACSEHVEWAVCAHWLRENPDAVAWLETHPEAAAL